MGTFKMSLASNRPTTVHQPSNGWEKKPITQFRINARHLGAVKNIANKNCEFKFESDPNYILRGNPRNNSRFAGPLSNSRSGHESPTRATLFPITFIFIRISSSCGRIRKQENTEGEFLLIPCNCQINPRFAQQKLFDPWTTMENTFNSEDSTTPFNHEHKRRSLPWIWQRNHVSVASNEIALHRNWTCQTPIILRIQSKWRRYYGIRDERRMNVHTVL